MYVHVFTDLIAADGNLTDVNTKLDALETALSQLNASLSAVKSNLDTAFTACGGTCPAAGQPDYDSGTSVGVDSSQVLFIYNFNVLTSTH